MAKQTFIQVRIDRRLKQSATDILNELVMDMPNAIRMFLKRIVIERGLPLNTKLTNTQKEVETAEHGEAGKTCANHYYAGIY